MRINLCARNQRSTPVFICNAIFQSNSHSISLVRVTSSPTIGFENTVSTLFSVGYELWCRYGELRRLSGYCKTGYHLLAHPQRSLTDGIIQYILRAMTDTGLINMEQSGMLMNGWQLPRSSCVSLNLNVECFVSSIFYFNNKHFLTASFLPLIFNLYK